MAWGMVRRGRELGAQAHPTQGPIICFQLTGPPNGPHAVGLLVFTLEEAHWKESLSALGFFFFSLHTHCLPVVDTTSDTDHGRCRFTENERF